MMEETHRIEQTQQFFLQGKLPAARSMLAPLLAADPEQVDCLQLLCLIAQQEHHLDQALGYFFTAVERQPAPRSSDQSR